MNAAHWHLVLNHIPVLATLFSIPVLVWGMVTNQPQIKKIALVGFIISALAVVAVFQSGESAEDIVENIPGISEDAIEAHEEAAEPAQWLTIVLGLGGLAGLWGVAKTAKGVRTFFWMLLMYSMVTAGFLVYTANLGGKIHHPEISNGNVPQEYGEEADDY